jgi:succinate dehydrogenase/fumarate reductase flavoprotein subunit
MHLFLVNSLGERIVVKHYPELLSGKYGGNEIIDAMAKEVAAGRGPICLDLSQASPEQKEDIIHGKGIDNVSRDWLSRALFKDIARLLKVKEGINLDEAKIEFVPTFVSGGGGPIRVDLDCKTTVEGLWASGDACNSGSSYSGARTSGSRGARNFTFCMVTGFRAGRSAGHFAESTSQIRLDYEEANRQRDRMLSPLGREHGIESHEVIYQVQEAISPLKYNFYREGGRLREALKMVESAKENLIRIKAKDYHELYNYHRAEAMAMSAQWAIKAAIMREESRGVHWREDYPSRDDKNWLKWILIKKDDGVDKFWTEDVPIDRYKFKP